MVATCHAQRHCQVAVLGLSPRELVLLHDVGQLGLVGEEEGEVGGEDAGLHGLQHLVVLLVVEVVEDVVGLLLEDGDPHAEVVVLHGGAGVHPSQRGLHVDHELVVKSSMINIVADSAHPQAQTLNNQ